MAGHNHAAQQLNGVVDVLWWTDHDWRIAAHTYVSTFDFEDSLTATEFAPFPAGKNRARRGRRPRKKRGLATEDEDLSESPPGMSAFVKGWVQEEQARSLTDLEVRFVDERFRTGKKSLKITAKGTSIEPQRLVYRFEADRLRHIASLASDVRLRLSVFPEQMSPASRLIVGVVLSQHPPGPRGRIEYVMKASPSDDLDGDPADGETALDAHISGFRERVVPVSMQLGQWNDLEFNLSRDAVRLGLGGKDNSLAEIRLIIETRNRSGISAFFDAFRIEREATGPALLDFQREMARTLGGTLTNHVGQEISYAAHLSAYGSSVPLTDFDTHPHGLSAEEAVEFVHKHGGAVSLNHVFGVSSALRDRSEPKAQKRFDRKVRIIREKRAYGADLLEVGYTSRVFEISAFLELWDALSSDGVRITGIGVSDSHNSNVGWKKGPNNFITWIYSRSAEQDDLIDGLLRGRAYFGNPTRYDGRMDIVADAGFRMGQVAVTDRQAHQVTFSATEVKPGQTVRIICNGRITGEHPVADTSIAIREEIPTKEAAFVRFELHDTEGVFALSNPLYFVPAQPTTEISRHRRVQTN